MGIKKTFPQLVVRKGFDLHKRTLSHYSARSLMMIRDLFVLLFSISQNYIKLLTIQKSDFSTRIKKIGFLNVLEKNILIYVSIWLSF